jgi:hypothetical protein
MRSSSIITMKLTANPGCHLIFKKSLVGKGIPIAISRIQSSKMERR